MSPRLDVADVAALGCFHCGLPVPDGARYCRHAQVSDGALALTGRLQAYPPQLILTLVHPTRAGRDRTLTLHHIGGGHYRAELPVMPAGKWQAQLAGAASTWRLAGVLHTP